MWMVTGVATVSVEGSEETHDLVATLECEARPSIAMVDMILDGEANAVKDWVDESFGEGTVIGLSYTLTSVEEVAG